MEPYTDESSLEPTSSRTRTGSAIGLIVLTAATFAYLGAYAIAGALASADVIAAWPADRDPRPRWFVIGFAGLLASFAVFAVLARISSGRQLRSIDRMQNDD
jgi:threonine/homoserine/homoserine lactone efflux protein